MTDGEELLLEDTITTAVKAEKARHKLLVALCIAAAIIFAQFGTIMGLLGEIIWGGSY